MNSSIIPTVFGVWSSKSWKTIVPLNEMSLLWPDAAVWETETLQNGPETTEAAMSGLSEVTV